MATLRFRRVMLKLSGEALAGEQKYGIDPETLRKISADVAEVASSGVQLALVIGGGNIFRGVAAASKGMDRVSGDYMGMLATVMNAMAMRDALEKQQISTRVMTAIPMNAVSEPFIRQRAIHHLEQGRVVICAAGTGLPFFTTDSAAVLRALELQCEIVLKATRVDGVFDKDPEKYPDATMFPTLTYVEVLQRRLQVMDASAIALCMDNNLPLGVFNLFVPGNIRRVIMGEGVGSIVQGE